MNTENIYNQNFDYAYDKLKSIRDTKVARRENNDNSIMPLFHCGDYKYNTYCSIVEHIETLLVHVVRKILYMLLDKYKIGYNYYPVPDAYKNIEIMYRESQSGCKVAFIIKENDKKIGYVIHDNHNYEEYLKDDIIDEIRYIHLSEYSAEAYDVIINGANDYNKKAQLPVSHCSIRDLFLKYFTEDEFKTFMTHVNRFNEDANVIISFTTVVSPTEWAIERFKDTTLKEIAEFDYYSKTREAEISENNFRKMNDTYINNGIYKILVSSEKFAESFFGAEWNYQMYVLTENLDLTGIVAGYLKSIEQLLYFVANYYIESGKQIQLNNPMTREPVYYTEQIDTRKTLGWLETFVNNNKHLSNVSYFVSNFTKRAIHEYGNVNRNPLSHKEIIKNTERVKAIREETLFLYFLILGSCKFEEEDFANLMK